eukprot:754019-Hanusia_phi.AAC.5
MHKLAIARLARMQVIMRGGQAEEEEGGREECVERESRKRDRKRMNNQLIAGKQIKINGGSNLTVSKVTPLPGARSALLFSLVLSISSFRPPLASPLLLRSLPHSSSARSCPLPPSRTLHELMCVSRTLSSSGRRRLASRGRKSRAFARHA